MDWKPVVKSPRRMCCCKPHDGSLAFGPGADVSAREVELLLLFLSDTGSTEGYFKSVCEGNFNSGNGSANKSSFSKASGDAKREKEFPGKVSTEVASTSAPRVTSPAWSLSTLASAVASKKASTSQHLAGSSSIGFPCSSTKY